ncbi:MAG TPA: acyltransferase domain-containing protein, partial [Polyangiaceae bacterium]
GNVVAGRIANRLDLGGTNAVVDAACASSLAAVDVAVNELALGRSDLAIAGGVDTMNDILMFMCFGQTGALSPTGDCRPFSNDADGTMLGEGIGMLALRRLEDAERDGDPIYAVIRGIGSSSDGREKSIYAPSAAGQVLALRRAYERAGYDAGTVELVEGHGTGTKAGDVAEVEALRTVLESASERRRRCALGSVKSQIGHTKAAAGAAGLIKCVMALHHKILPRTIKVNAPTPVLGGDAGALYVNTKTRPWVRGGDHPRRASVSSLGFGGTNFHVAVEEYRGPSARPSRLRTSPTELVLFAAEDVRALAAACRNEAMNDRGLSSIARRTQLAFEPTLPARLAIVATDAADLRDKLRAAAEALEKGDEPPRGIRLGRGAASGPIAFLFPGQGSQYVGMGGDLAVHMDCVRDVWDRAADVPTGGAERIPDRVFPPPVFGVDAENALEERLRATEWAQPAIAATSLSMLRVVERLGLEPVCVAGHSLGELTALAAAGVLGTDDLLAVARKRGELVGEAALQVPGAMTAVVSARSEVERIVARVAPDVVIANHNAPDQVVLSGPVTAIAAIEQTLAAERIATRRLAVSTAFHSPLVAAASKPFGDFLTGIPIGTARVPVLSNATADLYPSDPDAVRAAVARAIASPVRFAEQVEAMYARGARTFIEIGPESVLTKLVERCLGARPFVAVSLDARGKHGLTALWDALGRLSVAGVPLRFDALWEGETSRDEATPKGASKSTVKLSGTNYGKPLLDALPAPAPRVRPEPAFAPMPPAPQVPAVVPEATAIGGDAWTSAMRELHAPVIAAQLEYQRLMAESHTAFLRAVEASYASLGREFGAALRQAPAIP